MSEEEKTYNYCGDCKHWHYSAEMTGKYKCRQGICDKIPEGEPYHFDIDTKKYDAVYDGWSFEDEAYDEYFGCFERREE